MNEAVRTGPMFRLRIIDEHGTAYLLCGSRDDLRTYLNWFETDVASTTLRARGLDDNGARKPLELCLTRETIRGMMLEKL